MKDLYKLTLEQALGGLEKKEFSSVELTKSVLDRIGEVESKVNAYISVFKKRALKQAEQSDKKRSSGSSLPLLGIPYSAKDLFNTKGLKTTAGSKVLRNYISPYESTVTRRLGEAGAILVGKTNLDAWAHGSSTETSFYGATRNPYDLGRLPGGSSGGSAACVVADEAIFSIGTETGGSIRHPSSWCGCVGLKPTYGRVSRYGVIAMASSLDSPGPLAKSVKDAGMVLNVIAGRDILDATTSPSALDNYASFKRDFLKGKVIGLPKEYMNIKMENGVKNLIKQAVKEFERLGARIEEISLLDPNLSVASYTILQRAEVSSNLARYDGIRYGDDRSAFGTEAVNRVFLGTYVLSAGYYEEFYSKAQRVRTLLARDFDNAFKRVDLILAPVTPSTALKPGAGKDKAMFGELQDMLLCGSTLAGLPGISIPCGYSEGLPVGIGILGKKFREKDVLNAAYVYEALSSFKKVAPKL